ncbi:hypothetical protein WR25_14262 [Diploscapter pachys]|uniref:Autophagy protein 5 n=1 Tax=Diploscapter pachys TaxID=2018661 RepID=A0A2A2KDB3_9BILA|nr:hypothetical protein WR25_14262 [Diploscapter pachys]
MDYEVYRKVWESHVPIEFNLDGASENQTPYYSMLPRASYLCLHIPKVLRYFSQTSGGELVEIDAEAAWLEYNSVPLKTYYPIGVLFDMHKPKNAQVWTVNVRTSSRPPECHNVSKDVMERMFMQAVKEADYLKHKGEVINSMKAEQHVQLWKAVSQYNFDGLWAVIKPLMECSPTAPFFHIPIRLYVVGEPSFRQKAIPPYDDGKQLVFSDAILRLAPNLIGQNDVEASHDFVCHGIPVPLNTPLVYLAKNLSYPDNFVHVIATPKG